MSGNLNLIPFLRRHFGPLAKVMLVVIGIPLNEQSPMIRRGGDQIVYDFLGVCPFIIDSSFTGSPPSSKIFRNTPLTKEIFRMLS